MAFLAYVYNSSADSSLSRSPSFTPTFKFSCLSSMTILIAFFICWLQSSGAAILYRFLGTSMDSTAARPLLRSLCIQIRRIYGKDPSEVANDFKTLCTQFLDDLQLAAKQQPLFLFLDSLDQLTDEDNGRNLEWLPFELPANVKIVVSTLSEEGGCLNKLRLSLPDEAFVEVRRLIKSVR